MLFIFGTRLFGKCDQVPGCFHVVTRFGHINFIPLIPMGSYVVFSQHGDEVRGVPIGLNMKSVLVAWLRAFAVLAAVVTLFVLFTALGGRGGSGSSLPTAAAAFACAVGLAVFSWTFKGITHAGFERACELGRKMGLTAEGMAAIEQAYGRAAGRGFEVVAAAHPSPAAVGAYGSPAGDEPPAEPAADAGPRTFFVTGVVRETGQATCQTVWADDEAGARTVAGQRGIDVQQVESGR